MTQPDGDGAASVGHDNLIKFYDVGGFDVKGMIRVIKESYPCGKTAAFVGEQQALLAVSSSSGEMEGNGTGCGGGLIYLFSSLTLSPVPVKIVKLHASPVLQMGYNFQYHCMISADKRGVVEYWNGSSGSGGSVVSSGWDNSNRHDDGSMENEQDNDEDDDEKFHELAAYASLGDAALPERNGVKFHSKLDTDLYTLIKRKVHALSLAISPTGDKFAIYGSDRKIRLFEFQTGKLIVQYDERMKIYEKKINVDMDVSNNNDGMDAIDYGNRSAREREMGDTSILYATRADNVYQECGNQSLKIEFDPTGRHLIVPTIIGIKIIECNTNRCRKIIGKGDASTLRFLGGVMCLGDAKVDKQMLLARMAGAAGGGGGSSTATSSSNKHAQGEGTGTLPDSIYITTAFNKRRFYVFSHMDPIAKAEESGDNEEQQNAAISREILNEPPDAEDLILDHMQRDGGKDSKLGKEAILRTTMGDIHIRLFPDETPRTVENFCGHARNGYYDNVIFHRVIKGFMIQTGDPLGDGTGGESIWGGEFEDEFVRDLRHDRPFTVSMANAGPGTNGSQFFITTVPTPWLDNKHTVFGRVTRGMDVCAAIENVKVDELDKPLNEISIVSVDIN